LKFFVLKQRLSHKATERNKKVYYVNEAYTTQTCSCCGTLNNPEASKEYFCIKCGTTVGRDVNAAKNILMKGLLRI
jgi:transposase